MIPVEESEKFISHQIFSFVNGAFMGWSVSHSLPGAVAGGVVNAIFTSRITWLEHITAAGAFGCADYLSRTFLQKNLSILTPFAIALFNKKLASNVGAVAVSSLFINPKAFTFYTSFIGGFHTALLNNVPLWQWTSGAIVSLCQYRIFQVIFLGYSFHNFKEFSQTAGKHLLAFSVAKNDRETLPFARRVAFFALCHLGGAFFYSEAIRYLTGNWLNKTAWLIPVYAFSTAYKIKHKIYSIIQASSFFKFHRTPRQEISRQLGLIYSQSSVEDAVIEAQPFPSNFLTAITLESDQVNQLKRYIQQLEKQLKDKPADPLLNKYYRIATQLLKNSQA